MDETRNNAAGDALQAPLDALEAAGLPRPPSLTLEQYLERLMPADVLTPGSVRRFLEVYQEVRYGSREVSEERVRQVCQALSSEIGRAASDEALLQRARQKLTPAPPPAPAIASRPTGPLIPLSPAPAPPGAGGPRAAAPSLPGREPVKPPRPTLWERLPSARSLALVATAVLVWSVAMLGVGYWQSPRIKALVKRFQKPKPRVTTSLTPRQTLDLLRKAAAARPEDLRRWRQYAGYASHIEQYADAIIGYHHIIARKPKDPEALNNLAWLYCTAKDRAARNRVRALALAERAYAVKQAPYIADTLAEACFLNGHYQRAVALEEDALRRSSRRKEFFRKQLEKFKKAAARAGATGAEKAP